MAHYAEIINGVVNQVLVTNNDWTHEKTLEWLNKNISTNEWVQTSYNGRIRGQFAGEGMEYHKELDLFIKPKPFDSWLLDLENLCYKAPKDRPGKDYEWNEELLEWQSMQKSPTDK